LKFLPYVFKHLRRNWVRSASTVAAIAVCIFLFCTLQTVLAAINYGLEAANASRLVTRNAVSLVFNLPLAYKQRIEQVEGVEAVSIVHWFGGTLKAKLQEQDSGAGDEGSGAEAGTGGPDFSNFFANFAVEPEVYLSMYPELILSDAERQAWLSDRRGALIGRGLANRYGWKVGDHFFLESFIPPYRKPDGPFEFVVRAIYDVDRARYPGTDPNVMYFDYRYLYEATGRNLGAGTYTLRISDPDDAGRIAKEIDARFENSDAQTLTETESAFLAGFVAMAGGLAFLLNAIGLAVTFTILLVTANTMSMAVRERRTEIAVLKTLGFPSGLVMALVLGEAVLIGLLGGALGLGLGMLVAAALPNAPVIGAIVSAFPGTGLPPEVAALGIGVSLAIAFGAGFVPAWIAYRARITEMLRQV